MTQDTDFTNIGDNAKGSPKRAKREMARRMDVIAVISFDYAGHLELATRLR